MLKKRQFARRFRGILVPILLLLGVAYDVWEKSMVVEALAGYLPGWLAMWVGKATMIIAFAWFHWGMRSELSTRIRELEAQLQSLQEADLTLTPRGRLILRLKGRAASIKTVPISGDDSVNEFFAEKRIIQQQELVVKLLLEDTTLWTSAPDGWGTIDAKPKFLWSGIVHVFEQRYPSELPPVKELGGLHGIQQYSVDCIELLAREVEKPDWPRQSEPTRTFVDRVEYLTQQDAQSTSTSPASPEASSQPPMPN
jgi:hypothetical protein